jgi:hypothetical protein
MLQCTLRKSAWSQEAVPERFIMLFIFIMCYIFLEVKICRTEAGTALINFSDPSAGLALDLKFVMGVRQMFLGINCGTQGTRFYRHCSRELHAGFYHLQEEHNACALSF